MLPGSRGSEVKHLASCFFEAAALVKLEQPAIKIVAKEIKAVSTSAFPTPAKRPHNSRLDTTKLQTTFGLQLPHWQAGVNRMLNEIDYGRTH